MGRHRGRRLLVRGAAIGVARPLFAKAHKTPDQQLPTLALGRVDTALSAAGAFLAVAAGSIDDGTADGVVLAGRVRNTVHDAAELTLEQVGHTLGPAPLALDDRHARRVADLALYLRQHHGERDQAALGAELAKRDGPPW